MTQYQLVGSESFQKLFTTEVLADQTLIHEDLLISCHRCVLSLHSNYFLDCFSKEFSDKDITQYDLSNVKVSSSIFESFIKILYSFPVTITSENCYQLFYCARYFQSSRAG
ncbi:hypothetical protein GEMRC1_009274 [Eukaryota sp. GEM-RC1]